MTDQLAIALNWFANYSNFYSIISVLICFCGMVVFILRLNGEHLLSSSATHYNVVKEQAMISLHNPFSVQLQQGITSSLKDGIHLDISVTSPSMVRVYWGVNIQSFQREMQLPPLDIAERYDTEELFDKQYLHHVDGGLYDASIETCIMSSACPDSVTMTSLGAPPRHVYPIVVVSLLHDCQISLDYTAIVIQFTVLHLKDSVCPLDSHIVYQFVKTNQGNLLSLQPIFMSSSDPEQSDSGTSASPNTSSYRQAQPTNETVTTQECVTDNTTVCPNCNKVRSGLAATPRCTCVTVETSTTMCPNCNKVRSVLAATSRCTCVTVETLTTAETANTSTANVGGSGKVTNFLDNENTHTLDDEDKTPCSQFRSTSEENETSLRDMDRKFETMTNGKLTDEGLDKRETDVLNDVDDSLLDESNSCIVCQNCEIFYTLLPCRHACVCCSCIKHLDRCPMCRSYIDSYFRLDGRREPVQFVEIGNLHDNGSLLGRFQAWNQRLNEMLGFA